MSWNYDKNSSSTKEQILLACSIISAITVYAKEILYSRVQTIEMDNGFLYLTGDVQNSNVIDRDSVNKGSNLIIISAFVDKIDNHNLVNEILTQILKKMKSFNIDPLKFENNAELNTWITHFILGKTKLRTQKNIFYAFLGLNITFLIATLFIGFNYSYFLGKFYEESLQTILGIIFGLLLGIPSCFIAGINYLARIASILAIPTSFIFDNFLIQYILTAYYWEQTLGNAFIFLGYLFFMSFLSSQIGGFISERRFLNA